VSYTVVSGKGYVSGSARGCNSVKEVAVLAGNKPKKPIHTRKMEIALLQKMFSSVGVYGLLA